MKKPNVLGVFETKTNLNNIISRASEGEEFIITKRGIEVAKIIPLIVDNNIDNLLSEITALKSSIAPNTLSVAEITSFKEQGRK